MRKTLILSFIILVAVGLTYALIQYIGMHGFLFAWALNLMLMMCVFLFTETLKSQFISPYYNEKTWESRGKIYESLGINFFRKLLVLIGWEKLNKKDNPVEKNTKALIHLQYKTKQSELGHLIILFIVLGFNIFVAIKFGIRESLWLLTLNILLNLYPIFLQRYNRPRLNRAIILSKHREGRY
ncbi:MAG: hypothetical protein ABI426_08125 [Flavobacterium sp.]